MLDLIRSVVTDESGTTAIEYGFIAVLVSLVGIAAFTSMGSSLDTFFRQITGYIRDASS